MEIRVTAINRNNGWAFIAKGDKMFLARPPYASPDHIIGATKRDVEHALRFNGFEQCDFTFSGLEKATRFLKEKYAEAVKERGIGLPSLNELKGLLQYASDDILLEYLGRADSELIPAGKYDAARSIAGDIMALGRENREIHNTAKRVLEKCDQSKGAIGKKVTRRPKRLTATENEFIFDETLFDEDVSIAIDSLPAVYKTVVLLADVEGLSYKEISDIIDCPIATVMSRLSRGRRLLRKRLQSYAGIGVKHKRLARLVNIMVLVKAQRNLTRKDLARKCEVSVRTIQRDIDTLMYAGVPIFWSDDGYEIMPDFFLSPANLSVEEALHLIFSARSFSRNKDGLQARTIEAAVLKIVSKLPDETQRRLKEVLDGNGEYADEVI